MKALILQHLEAESPGPLAQYLTEDGVDWHVVRLFAGEGIPALDDIDLLFVLGGPQDVWRESRYMWLADEKKVVAQAVRTHGIPTLGIAMGHHVLAAALGGTVQQMPAPEIGVFEVEMTAHGASDPLLYGIDATARVFQWHGSEVVTVPEGAVVLASSQSCAIQAVRYARNAYGIQFYLEMSGQALSQLATDPAYAEFLQAGTDQVAGTTTVHQAQDALQTMAHITHQQGRRLYQNFMTIVREEALLSETSMDLGWEKL